MDRFKFVRLTSAPIGRVGTQLHINLTHLLIIELEMPTWTQQEVRKGQLELWNIVFASCYVGKLGQELSPFSPKQCYKYMWYFWIAIIITCNGIFTGNMHYFQNILKPKETWEMWQYCNKNWKDLKIENNLTLILLNFLFYFL